MATIDEQLRSTLAAVAPGTATITGTSGSGRANVLTMRNDGTLALTAGRVLVWSSRTAR